MLPIQVELELYEYALALDVSNRRQLMSLKAGNRDVTGYDSHTVDSYKDQVEGVAAEIAVAKALGVYWDGSVGTYHNIPDLMGFIEVKWCRSDTNPRMVIRPSSKERKQDAFVLVTGDKGSYKIHGWRTRDWVEANVLQSIGDPTRPPAWFCPADQLLPLPTLYKTVVGQLVNILLTSSEEPPVQQAVFVPAPQPPTPPVASVAPRKPSFLQEEPHPLPGKPKR